MDDDISTWLFDVLQSINEIEGYFPGTKNFSLYQADIRTKRAVERNLEIIGEAINRILEKEPDFQIPEARKIISLRNRIIHEYDKVSDEIIWGIVINHIPILKKAVEGFL